MSVPYYDPALHFDIWDETLSDDELVMGLHMFIRSQRSLIKEVHARAPKPSSNHTSRLLELMANRVLVAKEDLAD